MQLEHSFRVPVGVAQAWPILIDIERIGPCMPGAAIDSVDGDEFTGTVKVKLGPINLTYKGKAAFVEKDEQARRAVIDARGRDARGNGTAAAKITATLHDKGGVTLVKVVTDLDITGKPAQFGRGVMVDVGNKLLGQFADTLAKTIRGPGAGGSAGSVGAAGAADAGAADAGGAATSGAGAADAAAGGAGDAAEGASGTEAADRAAAAAESAGAPGAGSDQSAAPAKRTRPKPPTKAPAKATSRSTGSRAASARPAVGDAVAAPAPADTGESAADSEGGAGTAAAAAAGETASAVGLAAVPAPEGSGSGDEPPAATEPPASDVEPSRAGVPAAGSLGTSVNGHSPAAASKSHDHIEPIDLLHHAGPAVAKRLAPLLAAIVLLIVVVRRLRDDD